jgi:DMSO/TMAO reductase YedYZ molybdopterin-dependent catalytic subunit
MTSAGPTDPTGTGSDAAEERASSEAPAANGSGANGTGTGHGAGSSGPPPATGGETRTTPVGGGVALDEPPAAPPRVAPEPEYGFPRSLWRGLARIPVPPPADPRTWRSPLRGTWLTSVFASMLLVGLPIVILTGLMSYIAYGPQFGQAIPGGVGYLHLPFFDWPSNPSWTYRLTQGLHVVGGMILTPIVLAKLWSVVPKLFAWPPVRSIAQLLERLSLLALVGGVLFEFITGLMNSQYDYSWGFGFYTAHYYGAWVFIAGFVTHVAIKLPTMLRALRVGPGGTGALGRWLHDSPAETEPEPMDHTGLAALAPNRPTLSRRGLVGMVGGGGLLVGLFSIGQTWDALRPLALLSPRGQSYGTGPNDFQINRTLAGSGINPVALDDGWRLTLTGGTGAVSLSRRALLEMPQHTATLPIACVEGWSVTRTWTGVRLRDLAALAGVPSPDNAFVQSIETSGAFARATLQANQVRNPDALLALRVGNEGGETFDLAPDHGYPARIIVPALPGVHNTKWVSSIDFRRA